MRHQWDLLVHIDETTASRPLDTGDDSGRDTYGEDDDPQGAPPTSSGV